MYLDHHATTPVDPRVLDAMLPWFSERFGNAASRSHRYGREAREAVERAREEVAALIGAKAREFVYESAATESDNLAIKGVMRGYGDGHLITQQTEHNAVLDPCRRLEREGFAVTYLGVDAEGRVAPDAVRRALRPETRLITIMRCNNEVGAVQDLAAIGLIAAEAGVLLHTDAAQGLGYVPLDVRALQVDLASLSAHKLYGPKGVGALYARREGAKRLPLVAEIDGGGHEGGLRSGTLNVPGIVGFGAAAALARAEGAAEAARVGRLRDRLWTALSRLPGAHRFGPRGGPSAVHPGNLMVAFDGVDSTAALQALGDAIALSSGSACTSAKAEPSHVLSAMGVPPTLAKGSLRFGLGRSTTEADIDRAAARVAEVVAALREDSPAARLRARGIDPDAVDW